MEQNKCPHDGATLVQTHLMYIEACPKCEYCYDVAHGREVEYGWVYGDYEEDELDDDWYEEIEKGLSPEEWSYLHDPDWTPPDLG